MVLENGLCFSGVIDWLYEKSSSLYYPMADTNKVFHSYFIKEEENAFAINGVRS